MDYIDKSNYLRGIMLLVAKDRKVSEEERNYVMQIGQKLGFEKKFCRSALNEILDNQFIKIEPPRFKEKETAKQFLIDGIEIAYSDFNFHPKEVEFLRDTAKVNSIDEEWFINELSKHIDKKN